ncbi:helix-turn-helix transcriptional regulator [Actinophytocola sp.]|uniref:helix-turn-helix domain-containing protein n=1 Tax=Actinophytocola sp. TaxID=1872138 RepID=UPI002ED21090
MGIRYSSAACRELGGLLRRIRDNAGLTAMEVARKVGWPLTKISRMEHGWRTVTTTEVILYAVVCGLTLPEAEPLLELTRRAERKQGFYLSDERIGGSLQSLIFHESSAEHSIIYEPHLIHGLLQTPEYARARIRALNSSGVSEETVAGGVRTRMERRQVLNLSRFTIYIHEQALRFRVGNDRIMHEQLLHLVLTAALDNVTIRIVPSTAGRFGDAFHLMAFSEHQPIVYLDNLRFGGLILEDPGYVNSYREQVPMLAEVALDAGQSREFAAELADAYDRGSWRVTADLAQEQPQQRRGNQLRGGGVVDPTPIYE